MDNWQDVIRWGYEHKCSDVFWKPANHPCCKMRGVVSHVEEFPILTKEDTENIAKSLMRPGDWEKFEEMHEKDIGLTIEGVCRLRINVYCERGNTCLVMRLIPLDILTVEDLDLPDVLNKISLEPQGLVLVTGPTGCGKSTTLAAMIDMVNRKRRANIITIEDPIEYVHRDKSSIVSQREVGIDTNSFGAALKYAMRQAPDVILIGEMRDVETMAVAMQAAETGHLVFSTVHTTSAAETMERIINMFPPHEKPQICLRMGKTLRAVISQALVPRKDEAGRIAALEIMYVTPTIAKLIEDGKPSEAYQFIEEGQHFGMQTKNQALLELYKSGKVSGEHALFYAGNYTEMRQMLRRVDGLAADQQKEEEAAAKKAAAAAAARARMAQSQSQPAGGAPPAGGTPPSRPPQ
ncbi:PilT/PilU family type 4a pilus ATPase [bacterium]|nr:PilT/PilU family type 4a pilus ATPase [bacterium]